MSAKDTLRCNKTALQDLFSTDHGFILDKVQEKKLITSREYKNLKSINKEDVGGHVREMVDKIMDKGETTCRDFLELLETDQGIKETYPDLKNIPLTNSCCCKRVQQSSGDMYPVFNTWQPDEQYKLDSDPVGLCVIINNENFTDCSDKPKRRHGTNEDAESLAKVFTLLRFRVLMLKDLTQDQMDRALKCFASLSNPPEQLQQFSVKEWSDTGFTDLQQPPKHGDAFICCVLSHGAKGQVCGIDWKRLDIKQITRTFKATNTSALTDKPKVFLIQACQGSNVQRGVLPKDVEADDALTSILEEDDDALTSIPEMADVLLAISTVEDYKARRNRRNGSWFIQSVCRQLENSCPSGEDVVTILHRVNKEVGEIEGDANEPGARKQMPEVRSTLRRKLVLSPR
uniref:Caspase-8-like n=1 Tax=Mastacembelus armatus TaxID=205130 RepID=A0A3Q3NG17_9TELE